MTSVSVLNPKADIFQSDETLRCICSTSEVLLGLLKPSLGPRGSLKMLVGGAGQIKITKDGNVFLNEVRFTSPLASAIVRLASAQDSTTGDGTTSAVILICEMMRRCYEHIIQGIHPQHLRQGIDIAQREALKFIETLKIETPTVPNRELLESVARTSLRTKIKTEIADKLADIVVDSVQCILPTQDETAVADIDLFMIEILTIKQNLTVDSRFVKGLVMDHGSRHPDMPKRLKNCYILTCNVSLEYERTEVNSGFFYSTAQDRIKLADAERRFTDEKVQKIIDLKNLVCTPENKMSFAVFNQKGIDPLSLDMLAKANILALRRVKRRNMERLMLCCGGNALNSFDDMTTQDLGFAGEVYEESLEDEKWTFVENVKNPRSCTILVKGPTEHAINQIKDALRDGLRSVKNVFTDKSVVAGGGAFEVALATHLHDYAGTEVSGKKSYGVTTFADTLLTIPKTLAENSGFDSQDCVLKLMEIYKGTKQLVGVDVNTGKSVPSSTLGIWDNYCVKRETLGSVAAIVEQFLLVDEVVSAGKPMTTKQ